MVDAMSTDDTTASEEMKRKFKEALDKKNAQRRTGEAHLDGDLRCTAPTARSRSGVPTQERLTFAPQMRCARARGDPPAGSSM
jgi:hypothetical protein